MAVVARYKRAKLRALSCRHQKQHCLTTTLCAAGWQFWQGPSQCQVDESSQEQVGDVAFFAGCPWMRLYLDNSSSSIDNL